MKLNYPLRFFITLLAIALAAWFWYSDGVERGLDLKGGASLTYKLDSRELARLRAKSPLSDPLLDTVAVIEERINNQGLKDVKVDALQPDQFEVQFPGKETSEVTKIKKILTRLGRLEFRIVANAQVSQRERERRERYEAEGRAYAPEPGYRWYPQRPQKDEDGRELPPGPDTLVEIPESREQAELDRMADISANKQRERRALEDKLAQASEAARAAIQDEIDILTKGIDNINEDIRTAEETLVAAQKGDYFTGRDLSGGDLAIKPDRPPRPGWVVSFEFRAGRVANFTDFTEKNKGRQMAILIDGEIESAPTIQETLPGGGQISGGGVGGFKRAEAEELVKVLRSGSLSVSISLTQEWSIGPSLGEEAIQRGVLATSIGLAVVVLFMLATYFFPGMVAVFALLMNLLIIMGALAFARAQLSLPGIAGVILTVGMAVDANILVFERIREELKLGKTLLQSVKAGYDRAFVTIVDANVTTLFTALVLYYFTTGQVRGFAAVLVVGILASMFTALFVTKTVFGWLIEKDILREFRMPHLFGVPRISYMSMRLPLLIISLILIVAGVAIFQEVGDDKYDIEFVGGQRVVVAFKSPLPIDDVKQRILSEYESATVVSIKSDTAQAADLDQSVSNDRYQITIEAAKGETEQKAVLEYLEREFAADLLPPAIIVTTAAEAGGLQNVVMNFRKPVSEEQVRSMLDGTKGLKDARIREFSETRVAFEGVIDTDVERFETNMLTAVGILKEDPANAGIALSEPFPMKNFVDPQTAQNHRDDAMQAVLIALVFQILYIYFRFHGASFGFAAVIALVHDVLITLGAIAFFGWIGLVNVKINLPIIAAVLTLIGYSMNDSIVVFDRIRENLRKGKQNLSEVIDLSVNQTMSRSLRTSITTFLVVLVLFVVNKGAASSVLEGFAFVLMIGVITGTYSSIFVASPMLVFLPWHYIRARGLRFWGLISLSVFGFICFLWKDSQPAMAWLQFGSYLMAAYPVYFLIDLLRWLAIKDTDRALNIALRSAGNRA